MQTIRFVLFTMLLAVVGCSASSAADEVASQAEALTTQHGVLNSSLTVPDDPTTFCHPTTLYGSGAHSVANLYPWGVPWNGGVIAHNNGGASANISSFPNQDGVNGARPGVMHAVYDCNTYDQFNGTGGTGQSAQYKLDWAVTPTLQTVSASSVLWDGHSACWIDAVGHLSTTGETAFIDTFNPPGVPFQWRLNVSGFPALMGAARCAFVGRGITVDSWNTATPGNPSITTLHHTWGTCFITKVVGNLDDGKVQWRHDNGLGVWMLEVTGGVSEGRGYCVRF